MVEEYPKGGGGEIDPFGFSILEESGEFSAIPEFNPNECEDELNKLYDEVREETGKSGQELDEIFDDILRSRRLTMESEIREKYASRPDWDEYYKYYIWMDKRFVPKDEEIKNAMDTMRHNMDLAVVHSIKQAQARSSRDALLGSNDWYLANFLAEAGRYDGVKYEKVNVKDFVQLKDSYASNRLKKSKKYFSPDKVESFPADQLLSLDNIWSLADLDRLLFFNRRPIDGNKPTLGEYAPAFIKRLEKDEEALEEFRFNDIDNMIGLGCTIKEIIDSPRLISRISDSLIEYMNEKNGTERKKDSENVFSIHKFPLRRFQGTASKESLPSLEIIDAMIRDENFLEKLKRETDVGKFGDNFILGTKSWGRHEEIEKLGHLGYRIDGDCSDEMLKYLMTDSKEVGALYDDGVLLPAYQNRAYQYVLNAQFKVVDGRRIINPDSVSIGRLNKNIAPENDALKYYFEQSRILDEGTNSGRIYDNAIEYIFDRLRRKQEQDDGFDVSEYLDDRNIPKIAFYDYVAELLMDESIIRDGRDVYDSVFLGANFDEISEERQRSLMSDVRFLKNVDDSFIEKHKDKLGEKQCILLQQYQMIRDVSGGRERAEYFWDFMTTRVPTIDESGQLKEKFRYEDYDKDALNYSADLLTRLYMSNSVEMAQRNIATGLADSLLKMSNVEGWEEKLNQIEDIFLKNNLPYFAKVFYCADILHPVARSDEPTDALKNDVGYKYDTISPVLKNSENLEEIWVTDLLKNSIRSNSSSLRDYLKKQIEDEEKGEKLLRRYRDGDELTADETRELNRFRSYGQTENESFGRKLSWYAKYLGLETAQDILDEMNRYRDMRNERNIESLVFSDGVYKLKKGLQDGDLIHGIDQMDYIHLMAENGINCKEWLGYNSGRDLTPYDSDFSQVHGVGESIAEMIDATLTAEWGHAVAVFRRDERMVDTRPNRWADDNIDSALADPEKYEVFTTLQDDHYGVRTGVGFLDIDYFVVDSDINPRELAQLENEIVKTGCYIPIVKKESEEVIFSPERFFKLNERISTNNRVEGSRFARNFELDWNISSAERIREIYRTLDKTENDNRDIQGAIADAIKRKFAESSDDDIRRMEVTEGMVEGGLARRGVIELLSTGSTARNTNSPGDADYDFILRLDKEMYANGTQQKIVDELANLFETGSYGDNIRGGRIDVEVDGEMRTIDVDVSLIQKTNKLSYSSEQSLQQRLQGIRDVHGEDIYKKVLANIIYAKEVMKKHGCYKPRHARENPQGGLGGVGIENWILHNGGSVFDAAWSFLSLSTTIRDGDDDPRPEATYFVKRHVSHDDGATFQDEYGVERSFDDAKKLIYIFDQGENHLAELRGRVYPYDEFFSQNMDEEGFKKMREACAEIIKEGHQLGWERGW